MLKQSVTPSFKLFEKAAPNASPSVTLCRVSPIKQIITFSLPFYCLFS